MRGILPAEYASPENEEEMKVIIDRFEGNIAVVEMEDGSLINAPAVLFKGAVEGDIVSIEILKKESNDRKSSLDKRFKKLFKD